MNASDELKESLDVEHREVGKVVAAFHASNVSLPIPVPGDACHYVHCIPVHLVSTHDGMCSCGMLPTWAPGVAWRYMLPSCVFADDGLVPSAVVDRDPSGKVHG